MKLEVHPESLFSHKPNVFLKNVDQSSICQSKLPCRTSVLQANNVLFRFSLRALKHFYSTRRLKLACFATMSYLTLAHRQPVDPDRFLRGQRTGASQSTDFQDDFTLVHKPPETIATPYPRENVVILQCTLSSHVHRKISLTSKAR